MSLADPAGASLPIVMLDGSGHLDVAMSADPTGRFGVGISRFSISGESYSSFLDRDQHVVTLQLSGPVGVALQVGGHRQEHHPSRGSIGILPAGADGVAELYGSVTGLFLRVSSECLSLAGAQLGRHGNTLMQRTSGQDETLFSLGLALDAEAAAGHPRGLLFWTSLADALIGHLATSHIAGTRKPKRGSLEATALKRVDDYIRANLDASLDIASLASVAGCERFRFVRSFRAATGVTPHRYVTRLRLHGALALARSREMTLAQVALSTGFYDQSHLTRWFRHVYGLTPGAVSGG